MVDINVVMEIVKEASALFASREAAAHIVEKGRADFVTEVDFKVQQFVEERLRNAYPAIQFMSEEADNSAICKDGYYWVLDPVDGTTNLIHDYRRSAISLALMKGGESLLGIIYNPYADEMFYAEKGKGSFLNGRQIFVSSEPTMEKSLIAFGTSPYSKEISTEIFMLVDRIYKDCADVRRTASAALDLADVACGRIEAYFERRLKLWDYAAGMLLIREAGGKVLYYDGREAADDQVADILAGNTAIADKILNCYFAENNLFMA